MTTKRATAIASLRDQRLDVSLGIISREDFDRVIALTEEGGVAVPDDVKAPIAMHGETHTADVGHGPQRVFIPGRTEQDEADR